MTKPQINEIAQFDLVQRLIDLEDERDIRQLLARYAHTLDYGLEDEFLACFTEDAVYEMHYKGQIDASLFPARGGTPLPDGAGWKYVGHAGLATLAANHTRAPHVYHKHMAINPVIETFSDYATSVSYITRLDVDSEGVLYTRAFGRYIDKLEKDVEDGSWRIKHRVAEIEAMDLRPYRATDSSVGA
ncbi:nuclear transport factor 2 family protein [Rhodococcus sp. 5G237]